MTNIEKMTCHYKELSKCLLEEDSSGIGDLHERLKNSGEPFELWQVAVTAQGVKLRRWTEECNTPSESYQWMSREKALVSMVQVIQGFEPLRGPLQSLVPPLHRIQSEGSCRHGA